MENYVNCFNPRAYDLEVTNCLITESSELSMIYRVGVKLVPTLYENSVVISSLYTCPDNKLNSPVDVLKVINREILLVTGCILVSKMSVYVSKNPDVKSADIWPTNH